MPIYEYVCEQCDHEFEEIQKFSDAPIEDCPDCNQSSTVKRKVSKSAFHLKGGGWYKDGYSSTAASDSSESKKSDSTKAASKDSSESKKTPPPCAATGTCPIAA